MTEAVASEMKDCIITWRALTEKLRLENNALDQRSKELEAIEAELLSLQNAWSDTKAETQAAITSVTAEIQASSNEVTQLEKQTQELLNRIEMRDKKTQEYNIIISAKREELSQKRSAVESAERDSKNRLDAFRTCRTELRGELEYKITKIQAQLTNEKATHDTAVSEISKEIQQLQSAIKVERSQWNAELVKRDQDRKVDHLRALREEVAAATASRSKIHSLLRDAGSLGHSFSTSLNDIEQLKKSIRIAPVLA